MKYRLEYTDQTSNVTRQNPWDELKDVKFAGEDSKSQSKTYNEKYINDFGRDKLREILKSPETLKNLSTDYLGQYHQNSQSVAENLAKKESLDHFVLERLSSQTPDMFISSQEFRNYSAYLMKLANAKTCRYNQAKPPVYPEFCTNPVLREPKFRELVFKAAYPGADISKLNTLYDQNQKIYGHLINDSIMMIKNQQKLKQGQIDILGDYLYSSKDFNSGIAKHYAEYCFNEITEDQDLKPSTPMLGALANYFASQYTIDDEVKKNSRFIIANSARTQGDLSTGLSTKYGCVLEQNHFTKMSLVSDKSLDKPRTNLEENNDIYRFMMVAFHELTHDHQRNMVKKGDKGSSSMMYIMRDILNQGSGCYIGKNGKRGSYYDANHDNDEIEIEADEESWRQCRSFLVNHQKTYEWNHPSRELHDRFYEHWLKCRDNEEAVRTRRTFTRKLSNANQEISTIKYNIDTLKSVVTKRPETLKIYPQLADYISSDGELNPSILTTTIIAKREHAGLDSRDDVFGAEFGTYLLSDQREAARLIDYVKNHSASFTKEQITSLTSNLFNVIHQTIEKGRSLKNFKLENYDETRARGKNFDMTAIKTTILNQYLKQCYNAILALDYVKHSHPDISNELSRQEATYIGGYYEELQKGTQFPPELAEKIIERYEKANNPTLARIANQIKQNLSKILTE